MGNGIAHIANTACTEVELKKVMKARRLKSGGFGEEK